MTIAHPDRDPAVEAPVSEPNEPIVWQPTVEPASASAPGSTPLTTVAPVTATAPSFQGRLGRGNVLKAAIGLVAGVAIVASVAVIAGTSPNASGNGAGAAPLASTGPQASGRPGFGFRFGGPSFGGLFGFGGGVPGLAGSALGGVTIASIDGTSIGLKTADGWMRTITLDSSVKITEAGRTMTAADLKVGQAVRLGEKRNSDGTFTVNGLAIVTPSVVGQVTAKTATTITIKRFDGTTQTIDVDTSTTYRIQGAATSNLAAVTVGMTIVASGPQETGGALHAFTVQGGTFERPTRPTGGQHPGASGAPKASPAPNASGTNG
jgi:hypothetical protein